MFTRSSSERSICWRFWRAVRYSVSVPVCTASDRVTHVRWGMLQWLCNTYKVSLWCYSYILQRVFKTARLRHTHWNEKALAAAVTRYTTPARSVGDQSCIFLSNKGRWRYCSLVTFTPLIVVYFHCCSEMQIHEIWKLFLSTLLYFDWRLQHQTVIIIHLIRRNSTYN